MRPAQLSSARLLVQLSEQEFIALLEHQEQRIAELLAERSTPANDGPLDRQGAANWLHVSLAKLDGLIRNDGLPFFWVGDCKRFFRSDLEQFVRARKAAA